MDEVMEHDSEDELLQILKFKKIDIRFLGEDYKTKPVTSAE